MFVVIGTTTVDLIVHGMPALAGLADGFRADNLVFCQEPLLMLMGGNGGNAAYVLGKLGAATTLCSSIGQDDFGDWLVAKLTAQGVKLDGLIRYPDLATSTSTILLDSDERQSVFHHKGATEAMKLTVVHETLFTQAKVLLASSYTLFPHLRAGGFARALQLIYAAGGTTALDIGPAIGVPVTIAEIEPLFPYLDYLLANTHELKVCTGEEDWETAVTTLLLHGCRCVIVKRGSNGAALRSRESNLDIPALSVVANISIGAGDAFDAGFLFGLQRFNVSRASRDSQDLLKALRFGTVTAALVVSGKRGVLSAPTLAEVEVLLHD